MAYPWTGPRIVKRVRDSIILNFRRVFSYDPKYTYVANNDGTINSDCSKISISDATAEVVYTLPSINVMTASGDEHRFLQEDFFGEFKDSFGVVSEERGAPLTVVVTVEATALDVVTRDELVDRMYEGFKIITDDLANNGVGIVKTSIKSDRKTFTNDRWFYTSGVDLYLYAEWLESTDTDPNSTASGLNANITTNGGIQQPFKI